MTLYGGTVGQREAESLFAASDALKRERKQYPIERRVLVTMHLPLDMRCVAMILRSVSNAYPDAKLGENGEIVLITGPDDE